MGDAGPQRESRACRQAREEGWHEPLAGVARRARLLAMADAGASAGSSSAKLADGRPVGAGERLWIAGVGDGIASRLAPDLVALPLDEMLALAGHPELPDAELLAALARRDLSFSVPLHATETLLHAFVPATHVDVTCPDGVMALCDAAAGESLARDCFGVGAAWVPFERDGLALARRVAAAAASGAGLALLAKRGLVTWGETAQDCHNATRGAAERASAYVAARGWRPRWGGATLAPPAAPRRRELLACLLPLLRRELSSAGPRALLLDDSAGVLAFLCARDAPLLADAGPACPRQALLTKRLPLWIDCDPARDGAGDLAERVVRQLASYRARARWEAAIRGLPAGAPHDSDPRVVLLGGLGMVAAADSGASAERVRHAYRHAIEVMAGAEALDRFVPPTALECGAFLPAP